MDQILNDIDMCFLDDLSDEAELEDWNTKIKRQSSDDLAYFTFSYFD